MTDSPAERILTGVGWREQQASLRFTRTDGQWEHEPLTIGSTVAWRITGDRRCIGIWLRDSGRRQPCRSQTLVPTDSSSAQCRLCAARDPANAFARGAVLDDPREFSLYLAYFGPGPVKVGLTATERGDDRLVEQGALAYTWVAKGSLRDIRAAELATAAARIAVERMRRQAKHAARLRAQDAEVPLSGTHRAATRLLTGTNVELRPCRTHSLRDVYGSPDGLEPAREIRDLGDPAVLTGRLAALIGKDAVLDTGADTLLLDTRLLVGRNISAASPDALQVGLRLPASDTAADPAQATLF